MPTAISLDNVRFQRIVREVNPRGVEKLHFVKLDDRHYIEKKAHDVTPSDEIAYLLGNANADHIFIVENASNPAEQILFISPTPEQRSEVLRAIREIFNVKEHEIRRR